MKIKFVNDAYYTKRIQTIKSINDPLIYKKKYFDFIKNSCEILKCHITIV